MVSLLATQLWDTALILRETEFAEILRRSRMSPDHSTALSEITGWNHSAELQSWELSYDPAIQRTMSAVIGLNVMGEPIPPDARQWVEWVLRALQAIQRIAAKCWVGVPSQIREVFLDFDDILPLAMHGEIADLRKDQRGRLSMRFAGLDSETIRQALDRLYAGVRLTPVAAAARRSAALIVDRPDLMRAMSDSRTRLASDIRSIRPGETGEEAFARQRLTISEAYQTNPELQDLAGALRAHNRLVNQIICGLLGVAEQIEPMRLTSSVGAIVNRRVEGFRHVELTVSGSETGFLRPTHPVWIDFFSPLDGLYFIERHTWAFASSEECDLGLKSFDPVE